MNTACEICGGACCESIVFPIPRTDEGAWLAFHGKDIGGGKCELPTPCSKLCGGKCSIHETRPDVCKAYPVGGDACRETVARRRPVTAYRIFAAMDAAAPLTHAPMLPPQGKEI